MTIFVFMLFNAVFWLAFEQAGSSLNLFTDMHTDRVLGGFDGADDVVPVGERGADPPALARSSPRSGRGSAGAGATRASR